MLAGTLRIALRLCLKPGLRAGRPVVQQRRWLATVARATLVPRQVRYAPAVVGGVPGEWVTPEAGRDSGPVVLYLHGGAYCVGSPVTHRALTGQLARRSAAQVFAADYRLAPEHPFPAAVDDAAAAFVGLLAAGSRPDEITIAGDSAGGGLAVATALRLRELGRPPPAALVLLSPWADLAPRPAGPEPRGEAMLTHGWIDECARVYLAGREANEPLASPLAAELAGLPPTLIQAGTDDLLFADSERLHSRLLAAGVDSTLRVFPRRWHVFQMHAGLLRDSDRALDDAAAFLRSRMRSGPRPGSAAD